MTVLALEERVTLLAHRNVSAGGDWVMTALCEQSGD